MNKEEMLHLLRRGASPALGCTEPVCAALAAADAAKAASGSIRSVSLTVSPGIYKNGMSVGIANFPRVGLSYAAALGALLADPTPGLALMEGITPELSQKAIALVESGSVKVSVDPEKIGIYAFCLVESDKARGSSLIQGGHTNILRTMRNDQVLFEKQLESKNTAAAPSLSALTLAELQQLAASCSQEELAFLQEGAAMNQELSAYSCTNPVGVGIARELSSQKAASLLGNAVAQESACQVAAAIEGRLDGCPRAAMSSAGSGSKGVAVTIPITLAAQQEGKSTLETLQALCFGHLVNEYINEQMGKLSPICTCALAASTGACAAITWLMGGSDKEIGFAIRNMVGTLSGMICDGGKVGCALKLAAATQSAFLCAFLAAQGVVLQESDGICGKTPEDSIAHLAHLAKEGMKNTDREILSIMEKKNARP